MIDIEKVYAVGKHIVVERWEEPKKAGSILLPNAETFVSNRGRVLSVGNYDECELSVGDFILWKHYAGYGIDKDHPRVIAITEDDVVAILPEPQQEGE